MYGILMFFLKINMYRCLQYTKKGDFACQIPNMQFRFSNKIGFFLTFITFRGFPSSLASSLTQSRYPVTFSRNSTVFTTSVLTVWSKPPKFTLCKKWIFHKIEFILFEEKKLECHTSYHLSFSTPIYFCI